MPAHYRSSSADLRAVEASHERIAASLTLLKETAPLVRTPPRSAAPGGRRLRAPSQPVQDDDADWS